MHNIEWSLVIFTLLSQFSVGIMVSIMVYQLLVSRERTEADNLLMRKGLITALIVMAVALVVSFLHLSSPLQSVFALSNLDSSWLSREILFASVYAFLIFIVWVYHRYLKHNKSVMVLLVGVTAISGVMLVYAMARLYMIPTVPAWNTPLTAWSFISSIFTVSPLLILVFAIKMHNRGIAIPSLNKLMLYLSLLVFAGLLIKLTGNFLFRPGVPTDVHIGFMPQEPGLWINVLYWGLLATGALMLIRNINEILKNKIPVVQLLYVVMGCLVCAEVIARALFYYSYYRIGL